MYVYKVMLRKKSKKKMQIRKKDRKLLSNLKFITFFMCNFIAILSSSSSSFTSSNICLYCCKFLRVSMQKKSKNNLRVHKNYKTKSNVRFNVDNTILLFI